jgi:hypothetical protein
MRRIAPLAVLLVVVSAASAQLALPPADNPLFEAGSWPSGPLVPAADWAIAPSPAGRVPL